MKVNHRVYIIICFEDFPHCVLVYHAQCRVYMCTHRPLHTVSRCLPVPSAQLHSIHGKPLPGWLGYSGPVPAGCAVLAVTTTGVAPVRN